MLKSICGSNLLILVFSHFTLGTGESVSEHNWWRYAALFIITSFLHWLCCRYSCPLLKNMNLVNYLNFPSGHLCVVRTNSYYHKSYYNIFQTVLHTWGVWFNCFSEMSGSKIKYFWFLYACLIDYLECNCI